MVEIRKQNNIINIDVTSAEHSGKIVPAADSSAYYSFLARAWANKTDASVDGIEYSSKHYAVLSKEYSETSVSAYNGIMNNPGFQAVLADLTGNNTIGVCAENISGIQSASSNAQIASNKAVIATEQAEIASQKALEATSVLAGAANASLSNLTEEGISVLRQNGGNWGYITGNLFAQEDLQEALDDKVTLDLSNCTRPYVTETYKNGASWYRVWSDGWCEQGGSRGSGKYDTRYTITLLKNFTAADYFVSDTNIATVGTTSNCGLILISRAVNSFVVASDDTSSNGGLWYACGYIS